MKTLNPIKAKTGLFAAILVLTQPAFAANVAWKSGGADQNWSTVANWSGGAMPTSADAAVFTNNTGAASSAGTVDNIVSADATIGTLVYSNTTAGTFFHTTQISATKTL